MSISSASKNAVNDDLLSRFAAIVGDKYAITDPREQEPYLVEWRDLYRGRTPLILKPGSVAEVSAILTLASQTGTAIVPQGGNTGLCGGSVPRGDGDELILSLSRMNRVQDVDAANNTLTVEAGCTLAAVQQAADAVDRLFPLSLAAEGSCQIGGNLSTNAGGVAVLRYGNARDLVLGLEVVLADGRVWNGLRSLRKDNTGYDLKHLFIGAEGTLGIITAAVLKLFPKPQRQTTALVAIANPEAAVALLAHVRGQCGDRLTGFEIIARVCLDLVQGHIAGSLDPLPRRHPWYVLLELSDTLSSSPLEELLERTLAEAIEIGLVEDAVVAASSAQTRALWALRENISEAQRLDGVSIKHDVSVPVSRVPQFIREADAALTEAFPGIRIVAFGHIGDGNIHYNCSKPAATENRIFLASQPEVNRIVYDIVASLDGSISAEHGLGQLKRLEISRYKSALELEMMRKLKQALDPQDLMNPGKVLP